MQLPLGLMKLQGRSLGPFSWRSKEKNPFEVYTFLQNK